MIDFDPSLCMAIGVTIGILSTMASTGLMFDYLERTAKRKFRAVISMTEGGQVMTRKKWGTKEKWVYMEKHAIGRHVPMGRQFEPFLVLRDTDGSYRPFKPNNGDRIAKDWYSIGNIEQA